VKISPVKQTLAGILEIYPIKRNLHSNSAVFRFYQPHSAISQQPAASSQQPAAISQQLSAISYQLKAEN